ncbi:MAG: MarR family winged helix-turn-helix transcriptional regulator [Janthinobacterium lividum]
MAADVDADDRLELQRQVCFTLAVASREVVSLYRPLLAPLGLTHPQYLVMVALWGAGRPLSIKELSRLLDLEAPTLSPLLKRLQSAGLVERQRDPADERSLLVSLTERGWTLRAEAATVPDALFERLGMSVESIETLRNVLTDLIAHAKETDGPDRAEEAVGT